MAFLRDDDALAMAVLAVCDALETTDATRQGESLTTARKHAQRVLDRAKKKTNTTPDTPAEGESE